MRIAWNLLMVVAAIAALLMSAGCSRQTDGGPEANTAAIPGAPDPGRADSSAPGKGKKPSTPADPIHPVVELKTTLGDIVIELDKSEAPLTVDNFLEHVATRHYEKTIFHQVLKDYVIMGGGYTDDLAEKKVRRTLRNEAKISRLRNTAGTISMVRKPDAQDSATCQFFINVVDNPNLDYKGPSAEEYGYCPFGKVVSGMEVVKQIAGIEVTDKAVEVPGKAEKAEFERVPKQAVVIQSVILR